MANIREKPPGQLIHLAPISLFIAVLLIGGTYIGILWGKISDLENRMFALEESNTALRELIDTKAADRYTSREARIQADSYSAMLSDIRERLLSLERKLLENK